MTLFCSLSVGLLSKKELFTQWVFSFWMEIVPKYLTIRDVRNLEDLLRELLCSSIQEIDKPVAF